MKVSFVSGTAAAIQIWVVYFFVPVVGDRRFAVGTPGTSQGALGLLGASHK